MHQNVHPEKKSVFKTHLDRQGRVLIPAPVRKRMKIKEGDTLYLLEENNALALRSTEKIVQEAQALAKKYIKTTRSLSDDLIRTRRREARPKTRPYGLSFGDLACLALGLETDYTVYTADQIWEKIELPNLHVRLIRKSTREHPRPPR